LVRDIDAYLTGRNAAPKPYRWKAKGAAIFAKINRARAALDNAKAVVKTLSQDTSSFRSLLQIYS
jgi:hypothetical protein